MKISRKLLFIVSVGIFSAISALHAENLPQNPPQTDLKSYCGKDAAYFRSRPRSAFFANLEAQTYSKASADLTVKGSIAVVNRPYTFPDGRIDFLYDFTKDNPPWNPEWVWQLNRMDFWPHLTLAYLHTGDERYAQAFDQQVNDWIDAAAKAPRGNVPGTMWRTLECGIRLIYTWPLAFEVFRKSPSVSDKTLERMLFSMVEQAEYAYANRTEDNWLLMEMHGCCTFASLYPELPGSAELWRKSKECLEKECIRQLLPDGMHCEISPDYQYCVYRSGNGLYELAGCTGLADTISPELLPSLKGYAESFLGMMTPRFTEPRNNDCYTVGAAQILASAANLFPERKDFLWGATRGEKGTPPVGSSRQFPYAGFTVMRSGWEPDAVYLCFDHGPLGTAHEHQDKLNIQLYKGGEELIFDDGGGDYEESVYRLYAVSGYGHNTVLADGKAQFRTAPKKYDKPDTADFVSNEAFDYAKGVYDQGFASIEAKWGDKTEQLATHQREILFVRPDYFCVADSLQSADGKAHDYTMLLHADTLDVKPDAVFPGAYRARYGKTFDLLIVPLRKLDAAAVKSAQVEPRPSGWFFGRVNQTRHPASTLELSLNGKKDAGFVTLLIPIAVDEPLPEIQLLPDENSVEILFHGKRRVIRLEPLKLTEF